MSNAEGEITPAVEKASTATGINLGKELQAARESKGLNRQDVALQLRLDVGIIEALENDDLEHLPAMTFVRGYLRSYARLVGLDESRVKDSLPETVAVVRPAVSKRRSYRRSALAPRFPWGRWLVRILLLALLVSLLTVIYPKAMQLWSARQGDSEATGAQTQLALPTLNGAEQSTISTPDKTTSLPLPDPLAQNTESVGSSSGLAMEEPPEDNDLIPVEKRIDQPEPVVVVAEPVSQQDDSLRNDSEQGKQVLVLQFTQDSWVELADRDQRLLFGMMRAGSTKTIAGNPPFSVKLGNAQGVQLSYEGQSFDTGKHTRGNVARFSLP